VLVNRYNKHYLVVVSFLIHESAGIPWQGDRSTKPVSTHFSSAPDARFNG